MTEKVDQSKRHFLTIATAVTGGVGIAFAAVPFLSSLKPSARARALGAPVEVPCFIGARRNDPSSLAGAPCLCPSKDRGNAGEIGRGNRVS
ncbi:MAG: ubiquinol-cytochrome c reductase iron-sulfur subunit N-terminal domain-containing protein [Rhodospirillales bacterium]